MRRRDAVARHDRGMPPEFWAALDDGTPAGLRRAVSIAAGVGVGPIAALRLSVLHRRPGPVLGDPQSCPCPTHAAGS